MTEAALLLRHANTKTTDRFYARATTEKAHDTARRAATIDKSLTLEERIDLLWDAWVGAYPNVLDSLGVPAETTSGGPRRHLRVLPGVLDLAGPSAPEERATEGN